MKTKINVKKKKKKIDFRKSINELKEVTNLLKDLNKEFVRKKEYLNKKRSKK